MANINLGIGSRKLASVAERHTTVPGTTYQLAGGIASVERCPLLCNLGSNQFLLVTQGSRDNAFDYSYNCIIGRLGTWATDSNGDTYVASLGDPYEIFNLSTYTEGTAWLNIGSLTAKPLVGATHTGRIILCFTIYDGTAGAITRSFACKTYSDSATGAAGTWSSVTKATYSGGYSGGTGDISASVIKVSNATPAGQLTCYTAGDNSRNADWEHYAFGPGNIVEKSDGTLVAFANHRYKVTSATAADKIPYTHCIYSTDGGDTWALGGGFVENAGDANAFTNEVCAVLKNVSDHIFISCRITAFNGTANSQNKRATTTVTNHAANWSTPTVTSDIGGNDCEAALTSASVGGNLYCTQVSNANTSVTGNRTCLGLWKSTDGGTSWTFTNMIDGGWVAYSATMCMDGTNFITVWERNRDINEVASFVQQIGICGYNTTWADAVGTNVRTLTYYFNEATSGAIPTTGHPLRLQGDMYGGGYGGSGGTYTSSGISCTGAAVGAFLSTVSPSNLAPWQFGGQFDPGLEAFTINLIGLNPTGTVGASKNIIGNRTTAASGQGWSLRTGVGGTAGRYSFGIGDGTNDSSKTSSTVAATSGNKLSMVISVSAAPTRSCRMWLDDGAGNWTESGSSSSMSTVLLQVKGPNGTVVGSLPDGSAGTGVDLDGLVFTRGAALTDTTAFKHSGNFTKTTWDAYNGFSGYSPNANSPETVYGSGCKTHLLANIDQGYNCKVDLYGYYPGTHSTIRPGDPVQTVMDLATPTRKWTTASNNRGLIWTNDATVGDCLRMQYVSASGNGYLTCPASSDFDFNVTGVFTLCFPMIRFNAETGGTQLFWDQISGTAANSGLYMGRVDTTGKIFVILSKGDGSTSLISDATFGVGAPAIAVGNTYFIALVGKGPTVKPSLVVGQWISNTQTPTLTSYDATAVMASLNGSPAATLAPYIGTLAGGGSGGANIRLLRDIFVTNTSASLVQLGKNAEYALNAGGVALRGGGFSLGFDLGI